MFQIFETKTADGLWREIMDRHKAGMFTPGQESRAGTTDELLHAAICIENPRQRWMVSRRPPINIAFALAEVIWILRGRNDSRFLNYFNASLPKFAGEGTTYYGAYGWRLRRQFRGDQFHRAYQTLRHNPNSRQVVLQIWDVRSDLPRSKGAARSPDIPCNICSCLKVRNGKLEWLQVMRSNDVFLGLPYNIVQFTTLQEVMAGWLGLEPGAYHQISDSLHLYRRDAAKAHVSASSACNSDNLALKKRASDKALASLENLVEEILSPDTPAKALEAKAEDFPAPRAYQNIARVLCAEGARRRRRSDLAKEIMAACDNPVFCEIFGAWINRCSRSLSAEGGP